MYDGLQSPGRNDECWCGSGKKYKKCHLDFDERLEELAEAGEEVPPRDLLKTPAEIEGIQRRGEHRRAGLRGRAHRAGHYHRAD